ncbi:restriction endonuclease subunit M [Phocaeicola vulgatus]|uniref:Restriction endonuclease subunit M n=1 Tax=Phocaeicola vulgatus TaxID=821 RepID=A0A6I0ZIL4_PHOVU|nr:restriction endonuclease subunit M [Phocaeicola vulgatus]KAB6454403.1 restriction endonuclease subunit M [Phocaeicola vulgatus]KAB6479231.1 restriction endonuclease subunit M [Phocaeicola vulgatus]MDB1041776.1 restriction endonuclease subunit M [Phocaeicola vulgatus]
MTENIDINETEVLKQYPEVLEMLLKDHTTQQNIYWATNSYADRGKGYQFKDAITIDRITGDNGMIIRPRSVKSKDEQTKRSKDMAEVFTPSWVCNAQNNLIDDAWFGKQGVFNSESPDHTWKAISGKIEYPEGKTWKDYVRDTRLEITCGEAPYLVSRYDTVSGMPIELTERIGLLDRKLRVVSENTETTGEFLDWCQEAYKNTYGYEWQGDNLLLAREALLFTFLDYYKAKFGEDPLLKSIQYIAYIISWNVWQMDGLKFCPPGEEPCEGDLFNPSNLCLIRDWRKPRDKQKIYFKSLLKS